jgi:hypothetical protein
MNQTFILNIETMLLYIEVHEQQLFSHLESIFIILNDFFHNRWDKIDISFLAHLTTNHQLIEREIGWNSIEFPDDDITERTFIMSTQILEQTTNFHRANRIIKPALSTWR